MKLARLIIPLSVLLAASVAFGKLEQSTSFQCGESNVVVVNSDTASDPYFSIEVSGSFGKKTHKFSVRNDFLKIRCEPPKSHHPLIVLVNSCGGSGCFDLDNWGIIDPHDGSLLLTPDQPFSGNPKAAEKVVGRPLRHFHNFKSCTKSKIAKPEKGEYCFVSPIELS